MKHIVFDLNGVLIQSPFLSKRFEKDFRIPGKEFFEEMKNVMNIIRFPNSKNAYSQFKPLLDKYKVNLSEQEFLDYWFKAEKENKELTNYLKKLKNYKLFILSNNFRERAEYYKKTFAFFEMFEKVYYSWQTGFIKPKEECFTKLLEENNLKAEECYYFDDSEKNVEKAKDLGFKSFKYESVEQVRKILRE